MLESDKDTVKFIRNSAPYVEGDVATFSLPMAERFIKHKVAIRLNLEESKPKSRKKLTKDMMSERTQSYITK